MPRRTAKNIRKPAALPEDDDALVRLPTVLGVYPVSESAWYAGIAAGRYPAPVRLGPRTSAWKVGKIRELLAATDSDSR